MSDKRIEDYLDFLRNELNQFRDSKFYGDVVNRFTIRNGAITRFKITMDKEYVRSEDLKGGIK